MGFEAKLTYTRTVYLCAYQSLRQIFFTRQRPQFSRVAIFPTKSERRSLLNINIRA